MWRIIFICIRYVYSMDPLIKDLLTPSLKLGEKCGYESCPNIKKGWINVHIVPHSHGELGYSDTFSGHYTGEDDLYDKSRVNMKRILDTTISELWADKRRKFTLSGSEIPYFFYWWSKRVQTIRRMVYELIRQGRLIFVGGGWGMTDEATTYYQSIIDSYTYSLRKLNDTLLSCGRPLVAWQADAFGHSREHTSLLAQMGYDGLFINPISFDDEIIRMERKGLEFIWRGSDDLGPETDIYTHKLFDGYWSPPGFCFGGMCSDPLLISSDSLFNNIDERVDTFLKAIRHRQMPYYNTKHVMVVMGQRMGYFDAKLWFANIDKLINNVNIKTYKNGEKIHLMYSNPSCYLQAVHDENPVLETKQDDFLPFRYNKDCFATGMYTSRPAFKYLVREANIFLQIAKQIQVLANLGNNNNLFEEFMWILGVAQDHNVITGAMRPFVYKYYTKKLYIALQGSAIILEKGFNAIRGSPTTTQYRLCYFNISSCPNTEVEKYYVIIYNPLAWNVSVPIRLPIPNVEYDVFDPSEKRVKAATMKIPDYVKNIPKRKTKAEQELVFIAENLPALGFRSYFVEVSRNMRKKKSLVKNMNKSVQKKYFIRQVSKDNKILEEDDIYDYFDQTTDITKIQFGNITGTEGGNDLDYVVTPEYKTVELTTKEATESSLDDTEATTQVVENTTEGYETWVYDNQNSDTITSNEPKTSNFYRKSDDNFIKNEYIQINIDGFRKVSSLNLSNGLNTTFDIQYYFYVSDDPEKLRSTKRSPGAYIFRSIDNIPEPVIDYLETEIYKSNIVEEIHSKYSDYAMFAMKLYKGNPFIELDWIIGPVSVDDDLGKEVFIRYNTDLENGGVFYTDANGRQMIKRIRGKQALFEPINLDPVAGNIYPVTSRIYIEDLKKNLRFSILNDRSQGGTSLVDGSIDLMLHRRILTDDSGVQTYLNETENDVGIILRGTHVIYLTKANYKQNRLYEKKLAKENEFKPKIMISKIGIQDRKLWLSYKNEFSGLKTKLPFGVHILTLEQLSPDSLLLRLENYLEKIDVLKSGNKEVLLKNIFVNLKLKNIVETVLSGHINIKDWVPLKWQTKGRFYKNFNDFYGSDSVEYSNDTIGPISYVDVNDHVTLAPQQIRTFIVDYEFVNNN